MSCLDLCDHMVVEPDGTVDSHLDGASAKAVYHVEMGDGPRHPELELSAEEFRSRRKKS